MAGSRRRLGQPGDGRHRRRDLWPAPVPRQPGQPLVGLRRLRADRQADIPAYRGHRLLLEYDDARSGGFEPLQHVPDDKMVVLGLITTKRGELENADELVARIEAASRYVERERLGIEPAMRFRDIDHRQQADTGTAGREAPARLRGRRKGLGLNAPLSDRGSRLAAWLWLRPCGSDPPPPAVSSRRGWSV